MVLVAAAGLVTSLADGTDSLLRFGAPLGLFGLCGWGAFWQPYVEVSDGGVTVANTTRTLEIPWPAVQSVDGRYGLRLETAYGPVTSWAAPAPVGRQRAARRVSPAAAAVSERLHALRAAGHLEAPVLERPGPRVVWRRALLTALATLAVAAVLLPLLG